MAPTELFAGIPVADYTAARAWYERLFGCEPDMLPHDTEAVWRVTEHGWVYVVEDAERAGRALVTVLVDDLDAHVAALASRGLDTDPIDTVPGKVRKAEIADPEGNRITFGQPLGTR
jgi:predicted enzyme related to lactoylglutathione lyase